MKTFLPYADFQKSAESLDDRRLARQRSDVVAILKKLSEPPTEDDHAVVKMWRGSEHSLIRYGMTVCFEYQARGNTDQTLERIMEFKNEFDPEDSDKPLEWLGDQNFHDSHKSYLSRSLPSHYKPQWPQVSDEIGLVWPRSPDKGRKDKESRAQEVLVKKAYKARERAEKYIKLAETAAQNAGLDPKTLQPLPEDEVELVTIGTPDPDLIDL